MLMAMMFVQSMNRGVMIWSYEHNYQYFLALCENKDKPELKCEGKCQIMKETEHQQLAHLASMVFFADHIVLPISITFDHSPQLIFVKLKYFIPKSIGEANQWHNALYQPPESLS